MGLKPISTLSDTLIDFQLIFLQNISGDKDIENPYPLIK
jgi:hypothetical protein